MHTINDMHIQWSTVLFDDITTEIIFCVDSDVSPNWTPPLWKADTLEATEDTSN